MSLFGCPENKEHNAWVHVYVGEHLLMLLKRVDLIDYHDPSNIPPPQYPALVPMVVGGYGGVLTDVEYTC